MAVKNWITDYKLGYQDHLFSLQILLVAFGALVTVPILTGLDPRVLAAVNKALAAEIRDYERMDLVGQLSIQGNLPCLTCGEGDTCEMSGVQLMFGPGAKTTEIGYTRVENQETVWAEADRLGQHIGERLQAR